MKRWATDDFVRVATEMYEDGTTYSERYSTRAWQVRNWPPVPKEDYKIVHKTLTAYIRYLRSIDEYEGREPPEYSGNPVPGTGDSTSNT